MDRNCELAFVNLLRQLDADNDASRIVERFEPQHRSQPPLHPAMVLLHNVVQVLTATNSHRVPPPEVELPVHSHAPQGAMARLVAIQGDAVWLPMMLQCLACLHQNPFFVGRTTVDTVARPSGGQQPERAGWIVHAASVPASMEPAVQAGGSDHSLTIE